MYRLSVQEPFPNQPDEPYWEEPPERELQMPEVQQGVQVQARDQDTYLPTTRWWSSNLFYLWENYTFEEATENTL